MNVLDAVIILILLADIIRGARIGFSRQAFAFAGFWGGLFIAALLAPKVTHYGQTIGTKVAIVLAVTLIIAITLGRLGDQIGTRLSSTVQRLHIKPLDAGLGAAFGAILVCLSVWIMTAMLLNVPQLGVSQLINHSKVVRIINNTLPPAPPLIARIQRLIDPNGFPQVFLGPEPAPGNGVSIATATEVNSAITADKTSVVKIEGTGCGGEVFGSGWIAAPGLIVTNAHVVAGIDDPLVLDQNGIHNAHPVVFDANLDIAVLRTNGLAGAPLRYNTTVAANGSHVVTLGYPGGGIFTASPGGIIQSYLATGRNIYDAGITARRIYELDAIVRSGNSGGPLVLPDGTVIGVVFARSEVNDNIGYALTMPSVSKAIDTARARTKAVSTGACAAE